MTFSIQQVEWAEQQQALCQIRMEVFVAEQRVPVAEEIDGRDGDCIHFLATDRQQHPIACARILPDGQIGRMAVIKSWRGTGLGARILQAAIAYGKKKGMTELYLHAQVDAIGFYQRSGFFVDGPVFLDAGIEHRNMIYRQQAKP